MVAGIRPKFQVFALNFRRRHHVSEVYGISPIGAPSSQRSDTEPVGWAGAVRDPVGEYAVKGTFRGLGRSVKPGSADRMVIFCEPISFLPSVHGDDGTGNGREQKSIRTVGA